MLGKTLGFFSSPVRFVFFFLLVALALRCALIMGGTSGALMGVGDDDGDHLRHAQTLYQFGIYATGPEGSPVFYRAWRAPLFSLFVYVVFLIHGTNSFMAVRLYMAFISLLIPLAVYWFSRRFWDETVARVALIWSCFHPAFIYYGAHIQGDSIFVVAAAWALAFLLTSTGVGQSGIAGVLVGVASLGRFHFLGALAAGIGNFLINPRITHRWMRCGLFLGAYMLVLLPWWVRNMAVFDRFVSFSTEGGYTLWVGNNDMTDGGGNTYPSNPPPGLNELELDKWHYNEAFRYMKAHPKRTAKLAISKVARFWGLVPRVGNTPIKIIFLLAYVPLFGLALWALVLMKNRWWDLCPFLLLCAYYTAIHTMFPSVIRYRLPLEPVLIGMASFALVAVLKKKKPFSSTPSA